jgi:hypothetical protein
MMAIGVGCLLKEFPKKNDLKLGVFSELFPYSCLKYSIMKGQKFGHAEPNGSHQPLFYADDVNMMGKVINWCAIQENREVPLDWREYINYHVYDSGPLAYCRTTSQCKDRKCTY